MNNMFIDFEHNGWKGDLLSVGLLREDGRFIYLVDKKATSRLIREETMDPWVKDNVVPVLERTPYGATAYDVPSTEWGLTLSNFITSVPKPRIIADWTTDIQYLMDLLTTGPGEAHPMGTTTNLTVLRHIDVYPTSLGGAVRHNSLWDALALNHYCDEHPEILA